jgi:hypothetical protein
MGINKIKQLQRENEQLFYQREMFWHEPEKQNLIKELLQKIYDLQDKVELLTNNKNNI